MEFIFNFNVVVKEIGPFFPVIKLEKPPENIKFTLIKTR